jgi:hypothetical protein
MPLIFASPMDSPDLPICCFTMPLFLLAIAMGIIGVRIMMQ